MSIKLNVKLLIIATFLFPASNSLAEPTNYYFSDDLHWPINSQLSKIYYYSSYEAPGDLIQKYLILRAVEYAKRRNKPFFLLYASLRDAAENRSTQTPEVGVFFEKASSFCYIKLLDTNASNAFRVKDYLEILENEKGKGRSYNDF